MRETVSLRDLPATIIELAGLGNGSPFPGRSLSTLWSDPPTQSGRRLRHDVLSELPSPSPAIRVTVDHQPDVDRWFHWPKVIMVYILNEGDGTEELYDRREDPRELINRAGSMRLSPS